MPYIGCRPIRLNHNAILLEVREEVKGYSGKCANLISLFSCIYSASSITIADDVYKTRRRQLQENQMKKKKKKKKKPAI
jgi:hypothetical protein